VAVGVAGGQGAEIEQGRGFWPAKLKSKCGALVSSLEKKSFTGVMVYVWYMEVVW
jgi:hypothetical protein